jgi:fluoride ion exporter CrcB/FEX
LSSESEKSSEPVQLGGKSPQQEPQRNDGSQSESSTSEEYILSDDSDDNVNAEAPVIESAVAQNATPETAVDENAIAAFSNNVSEHLARMQRVRLVDGWDVKSTPEEMSDDLMLGLRDGFCGAVSSFSSWNSAMVALMREGQINKGLVGYCIGIQLPIIFYRFGQHVAVFLFMWKCRQETKRDERRGYGIRLNQKDDSEDDDAENHSLPLPGEISRKAKLKSPPRNGRQEARGRETPSVRAIATALFIMSLVTQFTSLSFFTKTEQQLLALSLLFSPLGTLARWRLGRLNSWRRRFPLGTFTCNILACALSGSLGSILAGNPGPRERVFLVSVIAGFGGTLSSVAAFVVEILAGIDPLLLKLDGFYYAVASVFWAAVVGFIFAGSGDWADASSNY